MVDIYRAAKRRGKYPPLFTDTEVFLNKALYFDFSPYEYEAGDIK